MQKKIHQILKKYWGYDQFRTLQEEIILSVLEGKDTLALLPTGGGKSICFQVPAMALDGFCLVVSPLIALMKDQVDNLSKRGIKAAAIFSGMSYSDIELTINNALFDKELKFLYVSPERLKSTLFKVNLSKMKVSMIAVDEAHCISQWGYDFRPPYLEIAQIRLFFPNAPVLALTATATPQVVNDIQNKLLFKKLNLFQKSFKRDNLTYYVVNEDDKTNRILRIMQKYPGSGIVYVRNRKKTKEVALFLAQHGITADFYHAGLDGKVRDQKQNAWMKGYTRVIVSTNAFGMGIDKPDVRFVIHIDIPDNIEAYFQEAGRAGRDGNPSVAIMLYDFADKKELIHNFELAFPPISTIQFVYLQLCNYYKIAINSGENCSFVFDMPALVSVTQLKPLVLFNSIKFLEKIGVILLSESVHKPSTLHFLVNGQNFELFQKNNPKYLEFTRLLLRLYSGIFSNPVMIDETDIAERASLKETEVVNLLNDLHSLNIVSYLPRTEKPQILFTENRVNEHYLYFDPAIYQQRKTVAKKRLDSVLHFVESVDCCRSQLLLAYFGETNSMPCGKCDVCLKIHRKQLSNSEFEQIERAVFAVKKDKELTNKALIFEVAKQFSEEKVIMVVRWLIDHNKL